MEFTCAYQFGDADFTARVEHVLAGGGLYGGGVWGE